MLVTDLHILQVSTGLTLVEILCNGMIAMCLFGLDKQSDTFLDVSLKVFLDEINIYIGGHRKADCA
jgi:hypothetical protein